MVVGFVGEGSDRTSDNSRELGILVVSSISGQGRDLKPFPLSRVRDLIHSSESLSYHADVWVFVHQRT